MYLISATLRAPPEMHPPVYVSWSDLRRRERGKRRLRFNVKNNYLYNKHQIEREAVRSKRERHSAHEAKDAIYSARRESDVSIGVHRFDLGQLRTGERAKNSGALTCEFLAVKSHSKRAESHSERQWERRHAES